MSRTTRPLSKHEIRGQQLGRQIAEQAPSLLLRQFDERPSDSAEHEWCGAWDGLLKALGDTAQHENVAAALHALDAAHGADLAATLDEAWFAAWTVAHAVGGGPVMGKAGRGV